MDRLVLDVQQEMCLTTHKVLIIEGHLVLSYPPLVPFLDYNIFIEVNYELAHQRRLTRTYDPPDGPGYFDNVVWPGYQRIVAGVRREVEGTKWLNADDPEECYRILHLICEE